MIEIGSEFWNDDYINNISSEKNFLKQNLQTNEAYLLSGRSALDFIIRDIKKYRRFKKVLLPDYCCDSMIEPFIRNEINIIFYNVDINKIKYDFENDADAVLLLDYFGYELDENAKIAKTAKERRQIVIYDSTHKLNGNIDVEINAEYSFCSYRKWVFCNYAKVVKHNGCFLIPIPQIYNLEYCEMRNKASNLKKYFITTEKNEKLRSKYLQFYKSAEDILEKNYANYAGVYTPIDECSIINKRRDNANQLIKVLEDIPEITLLRSKVKKFDAPLFVPILIDSSIRENLKNHLIENKIFCPIHWPFTKYHSKNNLLYDNELSLICDQRYSSEDIYREAYIISDFFKRKGKIYC